MVVDVVRSPDCWSASEFQRALEAGEVAAARVWNDQYVFYASSSRAGSTTVECAGPIDLADLLAWLAKKRVPWREIVPVIP